MEKNGTCPCCGRHCDLSAPQCGRGEEYLRTGTIPERPHGKGRPSREERMIHYRAADMQDKLVINLRDLAHVIRSVSDGRESQKRILIILDEVGTITQQRLTERLGIQPGSASEVLSKLESAGLITRTPSQADRRTTDVQLTETGKMQAKEAVGQRQIRHEEMFSCLSQTERETLLSLLEKLNDDWEDRYRRGHNGRHDHGEHGHGEHGHEREGHEHGHSHGGRGGKFHN